MLLQEQNFGVEIELTGITRIKAAKTISEYFGTISRYVGTGYDTYAAEDRKGRTWKAMSDGSIHATRKVNGQQVPADSKYRCEIVTPILQYEDIEDMSIINESGLYALILSSKLLSVEEFKRWTTSEVLPSLRIHF